MMLDHEDGLTGTEIDLYDCRDTFMEYIDEASIT